MEKTDGLVILVGACDRIRYHPNVVKVYHRETLGR